MFAYGLLPAATNKRKYRKKEEKEEYRGIYISIYMLMFPYTPLFLNV